MAEPNYSYITTRFGQGGHRGVDICAPSGTPIYSCDGGTVVEAGYRIGDRVIRAARVVVASPQN